LRLRLRHRSTAIATPALPFLKLIM
jgi:hypothetical protein